MTVAYLGVGAVLEAEPAWDEQEELEVRLIPLGALTGAIRRNEITSAGTVATVYRALDELGQAPAP